MLDSPVDGVIDSIPVDLVDTAQDVVSEEPKKEETQDGNGGGGGGGGGSSSEPRVENKKPQIVVDGQGEPKPKPSPVASAHAVAADSPPVSAPSHDKRASSPHRSTCFICCFYPRAD